MDEIRRKRLEKLQNAAKSSGEQENPQNKQNLSQEQNAAPGGSQANSSAASSKPVSKPPVTKPSEAPAAPKPAAPKPAPRHIPPKQDVKDNLQLLSEVLDIKLAPGTETNAETINEALTTHILEQPHSDPANKPLAYLYGVFERSSRLPRDLYDEVRRQVFTYSALTCEVDESEPFHDKFGDFLFNSLKTKHFDPDFVVGVLEQCGTAQMPIFTTILISVVRRFGFGDPEVRTIFDIFMRIVDIPSVAETLLAVPSPDTWSKMMKTDLKSALHGIAHDSTMGVLCKLSVTQEKAAELLPVNIQKDVNIQIGALKPILKDNMIIAESTDAMLIALAKKLVRKSANSRRLVLLWYKYLLDANHATTATAWRPDRSNEFHLLITAFRVILALAEPFLQLNDPDLDKQLAKVNPNYFAYRFSYNVSDQTKLLSEEDPAFNRQGLDGELNFVTECFFIAVGLLHFAVSACIESLNVRTGSLVRFTEAMNTHELQMYQQVIVELERLGPQPDSPAGMSTNNQLMAPGAKERFIKQFVERSIIVRKANVASLCVRLESVEFLTVVSKLCQFLFAFDLRTANNGVITSAWTQPPPECFACLPEFFLEAPAQVLRYVMHTYAFLRDQLVGSRMEIAINASVLFMSSPALVKNPYLRCKFAEILYLGSVSITSTSDVPEPGPLFYMLCSSKTCQEHLLPALMSAFIDIEHTGRSSQFYEKFSIRNLISRIMKLMWLDEHFRKQLTKESEEKSEFFVKFVALLLNDSTYVLDEALTILSELHKLSTEAPDEEMHSSGSSVQRADGQGGAGNEGTAEASGNDNEDEDEENGDGPRRQPETREQKIAKLRSRVKDFLILSTAYIDLLKAFTSSAPHIFATREIVDRFAVMLNYNLAALVGPRCRELRVDNPSEIEFHPRDLLRSVVKVYIFMRKEPSFPKAIAKDERSYSPDLFKRAIGVMKKTPIISPMELEEFEKLSSDALAAWEETREEDEDLGDDIPDEFLDPLMFTIMEEPVTLPTSKVNIDLSTIKSHLLNDPTDPFNRVPLKIEDVIPNLELKQQIEEFRQQKKKNKH